MSDLTNWLRVIAKEMAAHDKPPSWHHPIVEAAKEIEKLRAAIKMALDCIEDVDVIGARQTLTNALGEKQ